MGIHYRIQCWLGLYDTLFHFDKVLLIKFKIMTARVNGLAINDIEKKIAIDINEIPNKRKHV